MIELTASREQEISELAEFIAEEYGAAGRVDPQTIAKRKKINFKFGHYQDAFDGMLEYLAGHFHIYCNLDRAGQYDSPRARFTFAHELGHYFIDEHRNALVSGFAPAHPSFCEYESDNVVEREADCFASSLLMPKLFFYRQAKASSPGMAGILHLKQYFGTSVTSTALRYVQSGRVPCMLLMWNDSTCLWKRSSDDSLIGQFNKIFDSPEDIFENSATAQALCRKKIPQSGYFESIVPASKWFREIQSDELQSATFVEQAIQLGEYGILTILFPTQDVLASCNAEKRFFGEAV
ncbi:MAG: ImmA/IrrE family metallo-endopeptidase [Chlorobiales bacterium]|nr:ImmA/IrrE family metallo-endopeptidase [Chlorobiales bacterium]